MNVSSLNGLIGIALRLVRLAKLGKRRTFPRGHVAAGIHRGRSMCSCGRWDCPRIDWSRF